MNRKLISLLLAFFVGLPLLALGAERDPWTRADVIEPATLAKLIAGSKERPLVIQVGFRTLYDQAHIPGTPYCGPASNADGLALLKKCVEKEARTREIVIYCGCCPWQECPNIRPAFRALREMGFQHVRVLDIPDNFGKSWVAKGFPIEPKR